MLLEDASAVAPMLVDHRHLYQGRALAAALPRSTAEVSALLAWCNAHRVGVVPQGGNTGYCGGATPDESGTQLLVGLQRMRRVRAVDVDNFSMTVEAGCTLAEVQQASLPLETWITMHENLRHSPRCRATFDALVEGLQQHIA